MTKKKNSRQKHQKAVSFADTSDEELSVNTQGKSCQHVVRGIHFGRIKKSLKSTQSILTCNGCPEEDSEDPPEVWLCLQCGYRGCGRTSVNKHGLQHYKTLHSDCHSLVLSTTSGAVWCYDCDDEISLQSSRILKQCVEFVLKTTPNSSLRTNFSNVNKGVSQQSLQTSVIKEEVAVTNLENTELSGKTQKTVKVVKETSQIVPIKGLRNLGNTCFFNAVMQNLNQTALLHHQLKNTCTPSHLWEVPELVFTENEVPIIENTNNLKLSLPRHLSLTNSLYNFLEQMSAKSSAKVDIVNPSPLFGEISKKCPQFRHFQQQDSHELLRQLLDGVRQEEIKRQKKAILRYFDLENISPEDVDDETKKKCKAYGLYASHTIIEKVFGGLLISTVLCEECKMSSQIFEPFMDLSLPLFEEKQQENSDQLCGMLDGGKQDNKPLRNRKSDWDSDENNHGEYVLTKPKNEPAKPSKHQEKKQKQLAKKEKKKAKSQRNRKNSQNENSDASSNPQLPENIEANEGEDKNNDSDDDENSVNDQSKEQLDITYDKDTFREEHQRDSPVKSCEEDVEDCESLEHLGDELDSVKSEEEQIECLSESEEINVNDERSLKVCSEQVDNAPESNIQANEEEDEFKVFLEHVKCGTKSEKMQPKINQDVCFEPVNHTYELKEIEMKVNVCHSQENGEVELADEVKADGESNPQQCFVHDSYADKPEEIPIDGSLLNDATESKVQMNGDFNSGDKCKNPLDLFCAEMEITEVQPDPVEMVAESLDIEVAKHIEILEESKQIEAIEEANTDGITYKDSFAQDQRDINSESHSDVPNEEDKDHSHKEEFRNSVSISEPDKCNLDDRIQALTMQIKDVRIRRDSDRQENLLNSSESADEYESQRTTNCTSPKSSIEDTCSNENGDNWSHSVSEQQTKEWILKSLTTLKPRNHVSPQECSIDSCLSHFTKPELLTGNNKFRCENCTEMKIKKTGNKKDVVYSNASKQILVFSPPAVLTLHLKRFQQVGMSLRKVNRFVEFPLVLDLAPYCSSACVILPHMTSVKNEILYSLYGIVEHSGRLTSGHYTAYVKASKHTINRTFECQVPLGQCNLEQLLHKYSGAGKSFADSSSSETTVNSHQWFYISDSHVKEVSEAHVLKCQAYLLFYERIK